MGIVGPNGAGKSTLLNLILDKLRPLSGEVRRNANLRIAHFTQHAAEQFDYRLNSVDNMIKLFPGVQEQVGLFCSRLWGWRLSLFCVFVMLFFVLCGWSFVVGRVQGRNFLC